MSKTKLKTRKEKIDFLAGVANNTRSIDELDEGGTVFVGTEEEFEIADRKRRFPRPIILLPHNGRERVQN